MLNKRIIMPVIFIISLLAIGAVSAADIDANDTQIISAGDIDEIAGVENDLDVSSAGEWGNYSDLRSEIGSGGNVELSRSNYRYVAGDGDTIVITTSGVIDGKGAVIDMEESNIRAFFVNVSGVTIKNLTIKNVNYTANGGAIYFMSWGSVENSNFINNNNAICGEVYFGDTGEVKNCNFDYNTAYHGGAVYFEGYGNVSNCNFTNNTGLNDVGAVFFYSEGIVTNCNFVNNLAGAGAAIYLRSGVIENCNFSDNKGLSSGIVRFYGNGNVSNCNFINNSAVNMGCAICFSKPGTTGDVINCNFINNNASYGGAVYFEGNGIVTNCNFANNNASYYGGAVYIYRDGTLTNCSLDNNKATSQYGGAVYIGGHGNVTDCNFTNNTANKRGGAVYIRSDGYLSDCNFYNNTASYGGAVYFPKGPVTNCNFTGNNATSGSAIYSLEFSKSDIISNSIFLNNRANVDANSPLQVVQSGNNIEIIFMGQNNILNAIYIHRSAYTGIYTNRVTVTNVTYWGANGITYIGNSTTLKASKNEAGQDVTLEIYDSKGVLVKNVTLVTDENGHVAYDYNSLEDGKYRYAAYHPDNCYYNYVKVTGNFIRKNVPNIVINPVSSIYYGETLVVNVQLPADVERRAVVTIGNESKYVSLKEGRGSVEFKGLAAGTHTIIASYNGDNNYKKASATKTVKVNRANVDIEVTADNINYGEDLTVNVKLPNDVARRAVVTIGNETKLVSLTDGSGSVKFKGLAAGTHTIIVSYNGDSNYIRGNNVNKTVKVYRSGVDIKVTANNIRFGEDLVVNVKLSKDVARRAIVTIGNETKLVSLTDGSGSVKFKGLALGTHTIIVSYNGDSNYIRGSTVYKTVKVSKGPANIKVTVNNNNPVRHQEPLTVDVLLPNATRRVNITIGNESKLVSLTNGRGTVNFTGLNAGNHTIIASYNGDSNYIKSSVNTTLNVIKSATEFAIEYFEVIYNDTITINLKFPADVTKRAVVSVNNETKYVSLKEGLATVEFSGLSVGTYEIDVSYAGDAHYSPAHLSAQFEVKT